MYKFLLFLLLSFSLFGSHPTPPSSQIFSTNDLSTLRDFVETSDENTLLLLDVDQTLITPDDPILKPKWEKLLDQLLGGKKVLIEESGEKRYVFREILIDAPHSLVDPESVALVEDFQKKKVPVIAFTAAPGGRIGKLENFIDWRILELKDFGFDFQGAFPHVKELKLPKDPGLEYPPIYKSGVLITSLHDKGPVLINFIKELNWKPKKVIFVDDKMHNLNSVIQSLTKEQIEVIGIHYTGAEDVPCELNEDAEDQVEYFLNTGNWISPKTCDAKT